MARSHAQVDAMSPGAAGIDLVQQLLELGRAAPHAMCLPQPVAKEVRLALAGEGLQAGKARRYKEYADRLQELRTQVGRHGQGNGHGAGGFGCDAGNGEVMKAHGESLFNRV